MRWWSFLIVLLISSGAWASIGDVRQQVGSANVERKSGEKLTSTKGLGIESLDTVRTQQGRTSIQFVDDTRVDVTENSKLVIDEFVYDPNTSTGSLAIKASFGTVRYASGQIAKNSRQNVKISTPTAVVGVRGTDFSMTVDETGSSTIILLPSCTIIANERVCVTGEISVESDVGTVIMNQAFQTTIILLPSCTIIANERVCVTGEISVESDVGTVIMNQAFQTTMVETAKSTPLKPIVLDLTEEFINNLLIITPPQKLTDQVTKEKLQAVANILDLDFLVFEELNKDYLAELEQDAWQTDLDFDPLAGNFLFDALDQSMENLVRQAQTDLDRRETNPKLGFDETTGVTILNQDPRWIYIRQDAGGNFVRMELQQGYNYSIDHNQNGNEIQGFEINPEGGSVNNNITIRQSN
jgi:hypothetical protein